MNYEAKNVKSFQGREGYGYECALYCDGKRVAKVVDTASGGPADFYWEDTEKSRVKCTISGYDEHNKHSFNATPAEKAFREHVNSLYYTSEYTGEQVRECPETFMSALVDRYEENKQLKRWCKKETVFKLKMDGPGQWRRMNIPYTDEAKKKLKIYKDNLAEVANERFVK